MKRSCLLLTLAAAPALTLLAQQQTGVTGTWRTPGGAIIRVASCGNDLCATLVRLEPNSPRLDAHNPDPAKRNANLCNLQIGYGFHATDPTHAEDGHIYDPKSGKTYKGTMTSEGDHLSLRGYVGIKAFGRSETWTRVPAVTGSCT